MCGVDSVKYNFEWRVQKSIIIVRGYQLSLVLWYQLFLRLSQYKLLMVTEDVQPLKDLRPLGLLWFLLDPRLPDGLLLDPPSLLPLLASPAGGRYSSTAATVVASS